MAKNKETIYLEVITTYFVDPHGSPDKGGVVKRIVKGKDFDKQYEESLIEENADRYYCVDQEAWVDEDDFQGSEDGYNSQYKCSELTIISEKQAIEYHKIIDAYNAI